MSENYILKVHRGTMFLEDDRVGGYEVYDQKNKSIVAIYYFGVLSQYDAYHKAEELAYELNTQSTIPSNEKVCDNCAYQNCEEQDKPPCSKCYRHTFSIRNEDCWKLRKEGEAADAVGTNPGGNPHNSLENEPAQVGGTVADGKEGE